MCLRKDVHEMIRSPRRRQIVKPRLSRKIVTSAKVNLNFYWAKFEKVLDNEINENLMANETMELGN